MTNESDDAALRALIGRIEATFGVDLHAWLANFARPVVFVTPVGTLTLADDAAAEAQFRPMFEGLVARGFQSTTADSVVIRPIGQDLALVDAAFTRRHVDGSVLERVAALYVCRRTADDWIVAALIGHPADVRALES
jgi:hypothetical protein